MALAYFSGNRISGLASDTKPTTVPTNSIFTETDTQTEYLFDGSSWSTIGIAGEAGGAVILPNSTSTGDYSACTTATASTEIIQALKQFYFLNDDYTIETFSGYDQDEIDKITNADTSDHASKTGDMSVTFDFGDASKNTGGTMKFGSTPVGTNYVAQYYLRADWSDDGTNWTQYHTQTNTHSNGGIRNISIQSGKRYIRGRTNSVPSHRYSKFYWIGKNSDPDTPVDTPRNAAHANDTDDTSRWRSTSGANPWIKYDFGAEKNITAVQINPHSDGDATEIKIQTSSDDVTYDTVRTLNYSALTEGANNFISFNSTPARYLRVYETTDAGSTLTTQTDFTTVTDTIPTGWVHRAPSGYGGNVNFVNNQAEFDISASYKTPQIYFDLQNSSALGSGVNASTTSWILRFKAVFDDFDMHSEKTLTFEGGLTDDYEINGVECHSDCNGTFFRTRVGNTHHTALIGYTSDTQVTASQTGLATDGYTATLYIDLIRNGNTIELKEYSNSARTAQIGSTTTLSPTTVGNLANLRYVMFRCYSDYNTGSCPDFVLDDVEFHNGTTSPSFTDPQELAITELKVYIPTDGKVATKHGHAAISSTDKTIALQP